MRFGIKGASLGKAEVKPDSKETAANIGVELRSANQDEALVDSKLALPRPAYEPPSEHIEGNDKLNRLVADDFPFDETQLVAIEGVSNQRYACMTGAAGTGKTTCTKAIVDRIKNTLGEVDMTGYFKSSQTLDPDDDYEMPEAGVKIPSICLVGFTGRSAQMIKKNFPREWHSNIMTIHRMLGFYPEWYEDYDESADALVNKMRFVPAYTKDNRLPWDVIVIDEAGMVSVDLWHLVWAAAKQDCRIIMIGDINQLPPVHGRSVFGFAMSKWPSYELTHIHRQVGKNNAIVDAAHDILKGIRPRSEGSKTFSIETKESALETIKFLVGNPDWKFVMVKVPEEARVAAAKIRQVMTLLSGKIYDPNHDSIITAINGLDTSRGRELGQMPMNQELAISLNKNPDRYIIDAGRERKQFAVGDKVMATKNDHEIGITNGMTGIITEIARHAGYAGEHRRFGLVKDVMAYMADVDDSDDEDFSLEDLANTVEAKNQAAKDKKEKQDRGPASHVVTVRFGEGEHAIEVKFSTLAEVQSLMTAYVVTCHKMQGGESPLCSTILHQSHNAMLYREWLYTAVTRSSERHILFYTDFGLRAALNKQKIRGATMAAKVREFQKLVAESILGKALDVKLPLPQSMSRGIEAAKPRDFSTIEQEKPTAPAPRERITIKVKVVHEHVVVHAREAEPEPVIPEGEWSEPKPELAAPIQLPVPQVALPNYHVEPLRLTHQPEQPKPVNPVSKLLKFGVKK